MIGVLLFIAFFIILYFVAIRPYSYWSKRNVQTGKVVPVFGDNLYMLFGKESMTEMVQRLYNQVANVRYVGCYQFQSPFLLIKSPEILKKVCVKDFDHFMDHRTFIPDGVDELMSKNLVSLKGQTWKNMRSTLSPTFTSSKMRLMFVLICRNAQLFAQHFLDRNEKVSEVEMKDAYRRYTADVIGSTAFGLEVNSLDDQENEFYMMGRSITNFSTGWKKLIFSLYLFSSSIAKIFRVSLFTQKERSFFLNIVKDTIKMRDEHNIKRPDMLGLLLEARDKPQKEKSIDDISESAGNGNVKTGITESDIVSQAFIFFFAGFDAVSSQMCFLTYELAVNPDVQKKLMEEIDKNMPENGLPSYETILNMTYLDMVVLESQRKWPISVVSDRVVTKPYTIEPELPHEKPLHLEVGNVIWIPIFGIHRDPKYYKNPEKFDPERFSPENRHEIDPYTFIPFGVGPRNCIGSRFALLEIKAAIFHLLSHFEIVPVEATQIPLRISRSSFNLASENDFPLGLKRRY